MPTQSLYSEIIAIQSKGIGKKSNQISHANVQDNLTALHGKYASKSPLEIFGIDSASDSLNVKELSSKRLKVSSFLQTEIHKEPTCNNHLSALLELIEDAYASIT
ncbi:MAG: hypothetical protein P1U40_01455 [Coxiellaceae bacterium]|nr:hypothetical protein [Coxiellaceae bacterium]